ncbi:MAG: hypothetical protein ACFFCW_02725 [Candidatus Hodarchaeota archaeon]
MFISKVRQKRNTKSIQANTAKPREVRGKAVILGMDITGLHVARNLGRCEIPVVGLDLDPTEIGFKSKYCCEKRWVKGWDELLEELLKIGIKENEKDVLLPTSDKFVRFIADHVQVLKTCYLFPLCDSSLLRTLNEKREFYEFLKEHDVAHPVVYPHSEKTELDTSTIEFPLMIKPVNRDNAEKLGRKGLMIDTKEKLRKVTYELDKAEIEYLVQELIDPTYQYSVYAYIGRNSEVLGSYFSRKVRQNPQFGVGTLVCSCHDKCVRDFGMNILSFLKKVGFQGLCEVEYAWDPKVQQFKVVEINTRAWIQNSLPTKGGINLLEITYLDLHERKIPEYKDNGRLVTWIDLLSELNNFFRRRKLMSTRNPDFREWYGLFRGKKIEAYFATDDLRPFFAHLWGLIIRSIMKNVWTLWCYHSFRNVITFLQEER